MNKPQNHYLETKTNCHKNKLSQLYIVIPFICNSKVAKLIYGDRKHVSDYLWLKFTINCKKI